MLGHKGTRANSVSYLTVTLLLLFSAGISGAQTPVGSTGRTGVVGAVGASRTEPGAGSTSARATATSPEDGTRKVAADAGKVAPDAGKAAADARAAADSGKAAPDPAKAASDSASVAVDPVKPEGQPVDAKEIASERSSRFSAAGRSMQTYDQCRHMAIPQPIMLNRLGAAIPDGLIFALRSDVDTVTNRLKPDKRPLPTGAARKCRRLPDDHLRKFNTGREIQDNGRTHSGWSVGATQTTEVSLHIQGMEWVNGTLDDGSFVGQSHKPGKRRRISSRPLTNSTRRAREPSCCTPLEIARSEARSAEGFSVR